MTATGMQQPQRELTDRMRDFLGDHMLLTLATRDPDGSLHAVPVTYLFGDGRFLVPPRRSPGGARRPDPLARLGPGR